MTKKDYIEFARIFRKHFNIKHKDKKRRDAVAELIKDFTDYLQLENSRFNISKFLDAVYLNK